MKTFFLRQLSLILLFIVCGHSFFALAQNNGYKLVWSDEFNQDGPLNESDWNYEKGFVRNEEWQWYQPENAICKDGVLVITARSEVKPNPLYEQGSRDWRKSRKNIECTSSSVTTLGKHEFLYGRFEVRARIPAVKGSWPAIWTLGTRYGWPSCGEIDIMEYYHIQGVPHILANVAWGSDHKSAGEWDAQAIAYDHFEKKDTYWSEKFHVWRMDWDAKSIKLYLDDELLNETSLEKTINGKQGEQANPFKNPHYLLLNLAVGGRNGGPVDPDGMPLRYEIDYVRIYQKEK